MASTHTEVQLYLESEMPEGLAYMECPACGGKDKLMLVPLDDGTTYYKCLRASCSTWGNSNVQYRKVQDSLPPSGRRTFPRWEDIPSILTACDTERACLRERYGLSDKATHELCVGTFIDDYNELRLVFPVRDVGFHQVGYMARSLYPLPNDYKALLRPRYRHGSLLAWYGHRNLRKKPIVIVEDQISAARIGEHLPCVALLGTAMRAADQLTVRGSKLVVVLDNDATDKGVKLASDLGCAYFPLMGPDVKDMKELVFQQFLSAIRQE